MNRKAQPDLQHEGVTTNLLRVKSSATKKMTASIGLTAAPRAAATPLFNQDFHAELRKTLKRHEKACIRKLRVLQPNCCMQKALLPQSMHQVSGSQLSCDPSVQPNFQAELRKPCERHKRACLIAPCFAKSDKREMHLKGAKVHRPCKHDVQPRGVSKRRN